IVLVDVGGCGSETLEVAVLDDEMIAGGLVEAGVGPAEDAAVDAVAVHRVHGQPGALMPDAGMHPIIAVDLHVIDDRAGAVFHLDGSGTVGVFARLAAAGFDDAVPDRDILSLDVQHALDVLAPDHGIGRADIHGPADAP